MYLLQKATQHNREMEGFDDLIFLCMPVLKIKDVLLTNTASWDWNNAQGLLRFCLHQPQRNLNTLELNSLVHPAAMAGLPGPFLSSWKGNSCVLTEQAKAKLFPQPCEGLRVGLRQVTPTHGFCDSFPAVILPKKGAATGRAQDLGHPQTGSPSNTGIPA